MPRFVLGLAIALCVAACATQPAPLASSSPVAVVPTPPASPSAAPATPTPTVALTPAPTAPPAPTPQPTPTCLASDLAAKVTSWQGAAGHRIASVTMTNKSADRCAVVGTPEVQLVGAHGRILMDSQTDGPDGLPHVAPGSRPLPLRHGASVMTLVDTDNYCGKAPALPTTVAFVLPENAGRLVASPGPGGDVPPCLGSGSPGSIAMNGWVK